MKKTRRFSTLSLLISAFTLLLFTTVGAVSAVTPQRQVEGAWDLATQLGDFSYQTRLEQTTQPLPSLVNAGLGSTTEHLYIEGRNNLSNDEMSMRIWVDGQSPLDQDRALEISIRDGRTYGRVGDSAWEEMDDISELIAPGQDNLGFLAAAKNVTPAESQSRSGIAFNRYTFDMDGPAFAQYMREQMEAELARQGALPPGVSMESSTQYADMTGTGEFWVDGRGLPLRLVTNMTLPAADGEQVSVEVTTDFADWDESLAAQAVTWQGRIQLAAPTMIRQGSLGIAAVTGLLGLFLATIAALQKIGWQRAYRGIAAVLVAILALQPLLQPVTVQAAYERLNAFQEQQQQFQAATQTSAEEQEAAQALETTDFDARQNPLAAANLDGEREVLSVPAAETLQVSPSDVDTDGDLLPDALEAELCTSPTDPDTDDDGLDDGVEILSDGFLTDPCSNDTDGDGLTDDVELLDLGTDPEDIDTDGDFISDKTEVQGFTGPDNQLRYLDATSFDTNADGREDGFECTALIDVQYDEDLQTSVFITGTMPTTSTTCTDIDSDGEPDVLDRDDDGDGVPDKVDAAPTAAVTGGARAANSCINDYDCMMGISGNDFSLGLSGYSANRPLLVDFQIRPDNPEHLQYMLHVLDWPDNDTRGQVTTGNGQTFGNSGRDANGDLRLFPLLEVKIPSENFTYPTLPKLNNAPVQISASTPITSWLDTTIFDEFSIIIRPDNTSTGDLLAYVPLNLVEDPLTGDPVAFNARMVYQPNSTSWGADHTTRLIWMVEVINPDNISQFIHVYEDEWLLSGLTVREDHGVEVALVYEDPVFAQAQNDYNAATYVEQNLWGLADGLVNSFLVGRTGNNGNRDLTVQEIARRWDKSTNSNNNLTNGDVELWDIPKEALFIDTFTYSHQGQLGNIPTEINKVLTNTFTTIASQGVVTSTVVTIAREEKVRLAGLDTTGVQTAASGKVTLSGGTETYVATQMAAYTYRTAWSPLAAREYWNQYFRPRVQTNLDQAHLDLIEADADTETRLGFYAYAYSTFLAQFIGLNNLVERGLTVYESEFAIPDGELAIGGLFTPTSVGKFSRVVVRGVNIVLASLYADDWIKFKATKDIRFAVNKLKVTSLADLQNYVSQVRQGPVKDALTQYQRLSGWKKLVYDQKFVNNHLRTVGGNIKSGSGIGILQDLAYKEVTNKVNIGVNSKNRQVNVDVVSSKLTKKGAYRTALIAVVLIAGVSVLSSQLGKATGNGALIAFSTFSAIYQITTIIQSTRQLIGAAKGISGAKNVISLISKANTLLKTQISQMAKVTGKLGVYLEVLVAVGLFIGLAISSGLDIFSRLGIRALFELVGTIIVSVLMFAISLIPGIGLIIVSIVYLIDAILAIFCASDKDANPNSFVCQGISGTLAKVIGAVFYGFQIIVDPTREDLVTTGAPNFTLQDPGRGFVVGNSLNITLPVTTTLYKNKLNSLGTLFRPGFFNDDNAKQSTFDYTITNNANYVGSPQTGADKNIWTDLAKNRKLNEPDFRGSKTITGTANLSGTGANALVTGAYFSLSYAIPGLECITVVCLAYTEEQTYNSELADIAFDVLPTTLDGFLFMTRVDGGNGYSFAWGQSSDSLPFPVFRDADGDGLASKAKGGTDPDDGRADADGDRLSDLFELQSVYELDPSNADTDSDGLTDYEEIYYNTDPTLADTDGDGLQDDDEILGWTIGYGNGQTTMVWSDPLIADADLDGYVDSVERAYGFNPNVANSGDILTVDTTFEEWVDIPAVAPCSILTLNSLTVQKAVRDSNEPLEFAEAEIAVLIDGRRVWFSEELTDNAVGSLNVSFPFCDGQATVEVVEIDQGAWSNDAVGSPLVINASDNGATVVLESNQQGSKVSLSYSMSTYNNATVPVLLPSDGYVAKGQEVAVFSTVRNELQVRNALGLLSIETPANWSSPNIADQPFILPPNQSETIYGTTTVDNSINTTGSYDVTSTVGAYFDPNLYPASSVPRVYTPTVHITFDDTDSFGGSYLNIAPNSTATVENVTERNPIRNASGAFDQAAEFSRVFTGNQPVLGDALNITDTLGSLNLNGGSFTMAAWVHRTTDLTSKGAIAGYMPALEEKAAYPTLYVDGDEIGLYFGDGTSACEVITPDLNPLVLNQWQHVAATFDATTKQVKIFLDGNRIHTASCTITPTQHYSQFWLGRATTYDTVTFNRVFFERNGTIGIRTRFLIKDTRGGDAGYGTVWDSDQVKDGSNFTLNKTVTIPTKPETFSIYESGPATGDEADRHGFRLDRYKLSGRFPYVATSESAKFNNSYIVDQRVRDVTPEEVRTGSYALSWEVGGILRCDSIGCGSIYLTHNNESMHFWQASLDDFRLYKEAVSEDGVRDIFLSADTTLDLRLNEPPGSYTQYDFSGLRNDGYCEGTACPNAGVPGRDSRALDFDGINDLVTLGTVADLRLNRADWTVAAWVYPENNSNAAVLLSTPGSTPALDIKLSQRKPTIQSGGLLVQADNAIPLNQWSHVAFTRSGASITIYVNGTAVKTGNIATIPLTDTDVVTMGGNTVRGGTFVGRIDQLAVRPATLNLSDVQSLIDKAPRVYVPFDDAANSNSFYDVARLTSYSCADSASCPTAAQDGQQYGSISFDGNDYLAMSGAQPAANADWTTSFWVKVDGLKNGNQHLVRDSGNANLVDIYIDSTGSIGFEVCDTVKTSANKIIPGTWNHIAVTYDNTSKVANHYLNGSLDSTQTIGGTGCASSTSTTLDLGRGGVGFVGEMDEVLLYNSVLSTAELRDMFEYQVAWFDSEDTATLIVDVDAPTAGFGTISALNTANPVIILTANDQVQVSSPYSGIALVEYRVDGGSWQAASPDGQAWAFTLDTSQGNSSYTVQVRATDNVGNVSTIRQSVIDVDTSGPTATLSTAIASGDTAVQLTGTAADSNGVSNVRVELFDLDGRSFAGPISAALSGNSNNITWAATYTTALPLYGTYDAILTAIDGPGNVTTTTVNITIDQTDPAAFLTGMDSTEGVLAGTGANLPIISGHATDVPFLPNESVNLQFEETAAPFYDGSPNRNHATCTNCPTIEVSGQSGKAASFDGVDDLLTIANASGLFDDQLDIEGTISFMAWVKPASLTGEQVILGRGADANNHVILRLKDGQYQAGSIQSGTSTFASSVIPNGDLNQWVHLAGVYNGGEWLLYRNGDIVNRVASTAGSFISGTNWTVGGAPFGGSHFNGQIDELLVYGNQIPFSTITALANPVSGSAVSSVEVGLLHLKDLANADTQTTWYSATLTQPNSLFTGWSLQIPAGIEGPFRLSLRSTDADGRVTLKESVWSGEIDTQAPSAVLSFWDEQPNRGAFFACDVSDYNLTLNGISCPVRGRKALSILEYQDAQWFVDVYSPTQKLKRAATETGRWLRTKNKTPQLTVCDLHGNCTTVGPTAGSAPVVSSNMNNGVSFVAGLNDMTTFTANAAVALSSTPTTTVRIETPVGESGFTDLSAAIAISGFITAENYPVTLTVKVDGTDIYTQSWASSVNTLEEWATNWTPSAAGIYTLSATLEDSNGLTVSDTDTSLNVTIPALELYISDQPPAVSINSTATIISSVDFLPNGMINVLGLASDTVGVQTVEARFNSQPWQLMQLNGTSWSGGLPYPSNAVADGDSFTLAVRATNFVSLTTNVMQTVVIDLTPPEPFTPTLSYDNNGVDVSVGDNETISAVTNPTLKVDWTSSSDTNGLVGYSIVWSDIAADGILTTLLSETITGNSSSYTGTEGQRIVVEVTAVDNAGNTQPITAGPVYLDNSLTPAYIDMAEVGRGNQPYRNWTADSCNVLGADNRRSLVDGELFPLGTQNFYGTWDAVGLRLAWQGADWNQDGDLFIYLDTAAGGADQLHNPYAATANDTLILLPPNMSAEYAVWVQDENTATLLSWNGSAWVDSGQPFSFVHSNNLVQPQTDLLIPFSSLGSPTTLSMVAVASEENALRLWASQPNNNSLNSAFVVSGADSQPAHLFSLTQAYSFSNLGSGVCPSAGISPVAISANATSTTEVIAYSQLSDGLFFAMADTLSGLRDWSGARAALCATAADAPLCDRALIGNPTPAALDFDARATLAGSIGLDHEAVGAGQTVDLVVNIANQGTASTSSLKADITVSGPLQLVGTSTVDVPATAAGETNNITIQVQVDSSPTSTWGSVDIVLYDGVNGSANEPLEWIFVDVEVDTGAPSLILLDPSQTTFNSATSQRLFGTYVDQSPLQSITFESGQTCTNDSQVYGVWSCVTSGPTAAPTAALTGTDIFGATSSASVSPRIANIQDTAVPTVGISLETELFFVDSFIEETETALSGTVADNLSTAAVEICRVIGGQEQCEFATVQAGQNGNDSYSYEDQTAGIAIPTCGSPLVRTFNVSDSFTIADLNVGLNLTHPFRNDVLVTLTSPQGTAVQIVAGGTGAAGYSLLLNDTAVNDLATDYGDHDSNLRFDNIRRPANGMITAFGAEDPQGTWQLSICDQYPAADNGSYLASSLSFVARETAAASSNSWSYNLPVPSNTELTNQVLRIYAIDAAGNRSTPLEYTYTIDTRGPQVSFESFFNGQVIDASGVDYMAIKYHGPNGETVEDAITLNAPNWSYPAGLNFPQDELYAVYVEARDFAGNTSTINVYDYFAGNNPPTAVDDSYVGNEDNTFFANSTQGVLANDNDPDGDRLAAQLVSAPAKGILILNGNGSFSFNPNSEFDYLDEGEFENVSFTYQAYDGNALSAVATVTIRVNGINDAPDAVPDTTTTDEDTAISIDVLSNDTDPEGQLLSILILDTEADVISSTVNLITGTVGIVTDTVGLKEITFDPNMDFETLTTGDSARVQFIYGIQDTGGLTDTATVDVLVTGVNDAPVFLSDPLIQSVQYSDQIDPTAITVYDVDADGLTFSQTGLPTGIGMSAADCGGDTQRPLTCTVTLSGAMGVPAGVYTSTIYASDGEITATQMATFIVFPEEAVATLDPTNRVVIPVTAAGSNASEPFSIMATIEELEPDAATYTAAAGNINLAQASLTLVPVDDSNPITTVCTPELVDPATGYNDVLHVSCDLADVPVNAYDIVLSIDGAYYDGADDQYILAVYDPSGGVGTLAHAAALENCIVSDDKDTVLNEQAQTDCSILSEGEAKIEKDSDIGGNITANDNIKIEPNTTVLGDVTAAGSVDSGQNVNIVGDITESAQVYQPVLPNITVNANGNNIKVEKDQTLTLPPGNYGNLEVVQDGTVNFESGQYVFEKVKIGKDSLLNFDTSVGTILLSVEDSFELQEGVEMITSGRVEDILIAVQRGNVKLAKNGSYLGTFVAPDAHIDMDEKSTLDGALYGDKVQLSKENTINGRPAVQFYFDLYIRPLFQNQPPTAAAGSDQTVVDADENDTETVTLDGTGSVDNDGIIETYSWTENGVEIATGATPNVTLTIGVHEITLTVTDNSGNSASDVVQITVEAPTTGELIYVSSSSGGNAGGVQFADEDILVFDTVSGSWSMYFDGSDVGLNSSGSQDIDAFTILDDDSLLFSTVGPSTIPGVGSVDDSDIVRFIPTSVGTTTSGTFELYLDGSDVGLTTNGEDIDAITLLDNGSLLLSTSGNFSVSGVSGGDEDLIRFDIGTTGVNTSGSWSMYFDGSDVGLNNSGDEDVWGAWLDDATGDLYLSTRDAFSVNSLSGTGADVFACGKPVAGSNTACDSFSLFWDGSANDFGNERMDGLFIQR